MTKPLPPEMLKRVVITVDWTEARVADLRRMWSDSGIGCPQIVEAIGGGATRNAVIGKARRLRLGPKPAISEARQRGQAKGAATRRAQSERQRVLSAEALAEQKAKAMAVQMAAISRVEMRLIRNPAFVEVEKPWDPYGHLRSDRGYRDAIAASTR